MDNSIYGQSSSFARIGTHGNSGDLKYFGGGGSSSGYPSHHFSGGYPGSQYSSYFSDHQYSSSGNSSNSSPYHLCFDDLFYHRQSSSEFEQRLRNSSMNSADRVKNEAEQVRIFRLMVSNVMLF